MKTNLLYILLILPLGLLGQNYNNPVGTINTCSGNFYDTGGSGANYGNSQNRTTTFCSNAGNCVRVNFSAFNIESGWDFLYIYDGPNTGSPLIGTYTGGASPGVVTSTSGCLTFRFTSDGSVTAPGWAAAISCVACPPPVILHPTTGIQSEYVGSCLVTDCGPFTYADNGGLSGNYSNNISTYRIFCPSIAGNCMRVTFNSFSIENGWDDLMVINGPTQLSGVFTGAPTTNSGYAAPLQRSLTGNLNGVTPFSFQSTDASGCLGFFFISDFTGVSAGWNATLQCVPCAGGPNGTDNNDCQNMTPLCSSAPITTNSTGPGIVAEGCSGSSCPAGGENHTNWYTFTAQTSGTLNVTVTPASGTDDYDFAIFGPNVTCGALGAPLRCSDSGNTGVTGAMPPGTGTSENVTGDGYVSQLNVIAGESYILVVDKWSPTGGVGYTLSFSGTASLDCTVLPVELLEFTANYSPDLDIVDLFWSTASEHESDYFEVERSADGTNYNRLVSVNAAGNTNYETQYYTIDEDPNIGINYYRLKQYDLNGEFKYSEVIAVNILDDMYDLLSCFPNPTTGLTEVTYNSYTQEEVQLSVTCYDGTVLVKTPLNADKGANRFNVDLSGFDKGLYFITIFTNNKMYSSKLVKE